jgi:hypothetical protein
MAISLETVPAISMPEFKPVLEVIVPMVRELSDINEYDAASS